MDRAGVEEVIPSGRALPRLPGMEGVGVIIFASRRKKNKNK